MNSLPLSFSGANESRALIAARVRIRESTGTAKIGWSRSIGNRSEPFDNIVIPRDHFDKSFPNEANDVELSECVLLSSNTVDYSRSRSC